MEVVPIAERLGLCCPDCGTQLKDRIGPFWCPACERGVSAWSSEIWRQLIARLLDDLPDYDSDDDDAPDDTDEARDARAERSWGAWRPETGDPDSRPVGA